MCNGREGPRRRSAFKSCRSACNAAEVSDVSEAAQAECGIAIKDKRFDFETFEEIVLPNVRLPSLHDVARRAEEDITRAWGCA